MITSLLFCSSYLSPRKPNEMFETEFAQGIRYGFNNLLFNDDMLSAGDINGSLRRVPELATPTPVIYRGWMLRASVYQTLYEELKSRNLLMINNPGEYLSAHYLPNAYPFIESITPKTIWFPMDTSISEIANTLKIHFNDAPIVLKDYVKSQKHYWSEACYIPSANREEDVRRVTERFLELQGDELVGGLVYREFVRFKQIGQHEQSGMPVAMEIRVFVLHKQILSIYPYWVGFDFQIDREEIESVLVDIIRVFPSKFFSIDLAMKENGGWMIVDIGDGQVSGIPDDYVEHFYKALANEDIG